MSHLFRKIAYSFFTIFLAITILFFIIRMAPGDPVEKILGPEASMEQVLKYRAQLGLDKPVLEQFATFLIGIPQGYLGKSLFKRKEVLDLIIIRMPPTLLLATIAMFFSTIIGTFLGVISAYYKSTKIDQTIRFLTLFSLSFPIFSLAPLLVLIFSIKLGLFPVSEWTSMSHTFLPALTLVIPLSSILARIMRNKFLEEKNAPWVVVLEAKGLSTIQILLRITKICIPTLLNVIAIQLSVVLAGTIITETIFDIPGMGNLLFEAIQNRDYPVVQGVVIYSTVIYMSVYFLIDYLNELLDPRIVHE